MTEPTTEAGRSMVAFFGNLHEADVFTLAEFAVAIEAEARADATHRMAVDTMRVHDDAMAEGRADALREAAERVRALDFYVDDRVFDAILDPEAAP